ncbi:pyridoxal phosphate-dependent aminotransferase [Phytohabitans kaempferiae]|uniref:Aminotransferase n=1 Tax=Phytohabitans kaempferiae TaxID=1620943 RepID=A0ABV6M8D4_9ACTN
MTTTSAGSSTVRSAESGASRKPFAERASLLATGGLTKLVGAGVPSGTIDLATGTPTWPAPPAAIVEQTVPVMRDEHHQYGHPDGDLELRTQIASWFRTPADPATEVTITVGATEGLCLALLTTVDPGDEVIVFEPCYENFLTAIRLAGGQPRVVRTRPPHWRYDSAELAAAFGPRTRAIVLNTPANPTGRVLSEQEMREIGELCERWDVTIVSDEIYAEFVFDGRRHVSAADLPETRSRSIVVGGLSKSHALSGWRLGYLRAEAARTAVLRQVHIVTSGGAARPLQRSVARAGVFDRTRWSAQAGLEKRRDRTVDIFRRFGMDCMPPEGGCYVVADIRGTTEMDSTAYVRQLMDQRRVFIVPGSLFFTGSGGEHLVRIAFNRALETLDAVDQRLQQLI